MSVLIKGMKMPKDCPVCPLAHWDKLDRFTGCKLKKRYFNKADMETAGKPSFCPLVELPPHGRLIDADAFDERIRIAGGMADEELTDDFKDGVQTTLLMLKTQKTIIEAEVSE